MQQLLREVRTTNLRQKFGDVPQYKIGTVTELYIW